MDEDVIALFHEVFDRSPSEREEVYARRQVPDSVRAEVESLLRYDAEPSLAGLVTSAAARMLLQKPDGTQNKGEILSSPSSGPIPPRIGAYRILRRLGEGGMGVVYEAEQEKPQRTVALKVVKAGGTSPELIRRFEAESQALGRLQHPGIAQIYEAGTADTGFGPQPYFAMEFIRGEPLGNYVESHGLNTRQRLELMARISEAVHHAHQRGIIHRDLKPGNILVDETGQPKILDFGVARVTDSDAQATRQTDVGQLIGTLAYMSPEQVTGDPLEVDTRSDVYALGVILYELLAKRLPYDTQGKLHEVVQAIREQDPPTLGTVSRVYRGDVETIVAKALEKDKTRRYASAAGLAGDIRRHLRDEPINARPPSAAYQLRKFTRRNKALVTGAVAVMVVLVAGMVASAWQAARAFRAEQAATQEAAIAKAINEFLQKDLLAQASAFNQASPGTTPDPDLRVRTALDRAAARIGGKFAKQPLVEASIRSTIGDAYWGLGLYAEALVQIERATDLQRRVLGEDHPDTLRSLHHLAATYVAQGKYGPAEPIAARVLEARRRMLGEDHPDTLTSVQMVADIYQMERKDAQAESILVRLVEAQRRVKGKEHVDALDAMHNLARVCSMQGKHAQARPILRECLELRRRVQGGEHPDTLITLEDLAVLDLTTGKYQEAETLASNLFEVRRRTLGAQHPNTLVSMRTLGNVYVREGKYGQAESFLVPAVEGVRRVMGEESAVTLSVMNTLGFVYVQEGRYEQAEPLLRRTLAGRRRLLGEENAETLATLQALAQLSRGRRDYSAAEALLQRVLDTRLRVQGAGHPTTLTARYDFGVLYLVQNKDQQAEAMFQESLDGRRRRLGHEHPDTVASLEGVAESCQRLGKHEQAEAPARQALIAYEKNWPDSWQRYSAESLLGAILASQRRREEAEPLLISGYRGLVPRIATIPAADRFVVPQAADRVLRLYQDWGKPDKAAEWRAVLKPGNRAASPR